MRSEQPDLLAAKMEMMPPFQRFNIFAPQFQRPRDLCKGNGIGFAAHLDQQGAQHRECERQLQLHTQAAPRLGVHPQRAAHVFDHRLHYVQTHPAPGELRHRLLERKAGQE